MKKIPYCFNFYFTQKPREKSIRDVFQINIRRPFLDYLLKNDEKLTGLFNTRMAPATTEMLYGFLRSGHHPTIPGFKRATSRAVHGDWEFELEVRSSPAKPGKGYLQDEIENLCALLEFLSTATVVYVNELKDVNIGSKFPETVIQQFLFEGYHSNGHPIESVELHSSVSNSINMNMGPVDEKQVKTIMSDFFWRLFEDEPVRFDSIVMMRPGFLFLQSSEDMKSARLYIDATFKTKNEHLDGWRLVIEPDKLPVHNLLILAGLGIILSKAQDLLLRPC